MKNKQNTRDALKATDRKDLSDYLLNREQCGKRQLKQAYIVSCSLTTGVLLIYEGFFILSIVIDILFPDGPMSSVLSLNIGSVDEIMSSITFFVVNSHMFMSFSSSKKDKTNKTVEQQEDKSSDVPSKGKSKIKSSGTVHEEQGSMIGTDNLPSNPLQMELCINKDGGVLELPDTGVSLEIPPGALEKDQLIQMRIIPYNFQGTQPLWRPQPDTPYVLTERNCVINLKNFSWEKFDIGDEIVEGKRVVLYAAKDLSSSEA
ncbi:hypothetical protein BSL78_16114 [Apostichopus japonicus]|uniref:ZU5 domain-containing protein n=1 Tax=Stichopus japonicus TaxID=307972 RepID=A0A2G8KG95_STIJA|nr:hypothetical protein BSL78_16114 [Apostichopus japonicus]